MNGWLTRFPVQGQWMHLHIHPLMSVAIISQWLQENYRKSRVKAITICGEDDMRKWRITTKDKVKVFCAYLKNNCGTGNAKVRIMYKKRHHKAR